MQKPRFEVLDAMRGVAAICVVMFHIRSWLPQVPLFRGGYLAVDLFFVLSGFVLEHAYGQRLLGEMDLGKFLKVRVIRLWPMYLFGFALSTVLAIKSVHDGEMSAVGFATMSALTLWMVPFWTGAAGLLFPLNAAAWSLSAEIGANTLYAALRRHASTKALAVVCGLSGAALVALALHWQSMVAGAFWFELPGLVARVSFSFPLGILLYRKREKFSALPALPAWTVLAATAALLAVPFSPRWPMDLAFIFVASPLLVAVGSKAGGQGRIGAWLGLISYPLYAFHIPVRSFAHAFGQATHIPLQLLAAPYLIGCLGVASVLAIYYDRPVRAWLQRWAGARPRALPAEAGA